MKLAAAGKQTKMKKQMTQGQARALLGLTHHEAQTAALQTVVKRGLTVRQTEELVRKLSGEKSHRPPKPAPSPEIKALEERLRTRLGTKVSLSQRGKGGTMVIHYYSNEELDTLLDHLLGDEA